MNHNSSVAAPPGPLAVRTVTMNQGIITQAVKYSCQRKVFVGKPR